MALDCSLNITGLAITTAQEFFVTYCITFTFLLLCLVPFRVHLVTGCDNLSKLHCFNIFTSVFVKIFCIWNIIIGLYWVAHQCGHSARSLKFLEEYVDHQAQIWKIFQKHQMIPDEIQDLHFHFDDFKNGIEKEFAFLKEATLKNIGNFQSSLNLQQMYSTSLCSHVNNIYNKFGGITAANSTS